MGCEMPLTRGCEEKPKMPLVSKRYSLFLIIIVLAGLALACARAGEIITDAEATQRALPTATPELDLSAEAAFQIGETAQTVGGQGVGALVPLYGEPGGRFFSSQINANELVVIIELGQDPDGDVWYQVEGTAGSGWIHGDSLTEPVDLSVDE